MKCSSSSRWKHQVVLEVSESIIRGHEISVLSRSYQVQ